MIQLRSDGLSLRAIALALGVRRETIAKDLRALQAPRATSSIGVDGAVRRHA